MIKNLIKDVIVESTSVFAYVYSLCGGTREKAKPDLSVDEKVKRAFYLTQRYPDQVNENKHTKVLDSRGEKNTELLP